MRGTEMGRIARLLAVWLLAGLLFAPAAGAQHDEAHAESVQVPGPFTSRQPVDDPDQATGRLVGTIRIPSIDVDEIVRSGVALSVIDQGPAHWVGTAGAGEAGNVVIAGHRTTHSAPFRHLDKLEAGDLIYLTNSWGFDVMYRVTETFIVEPDAIWITYPTTQPTLTMFACHPLGSVAQRIVVRAQLVGGRLLA